MKLTHQRSHRRRFGVATLFVSASLAVGIHATANAQTAAKKVLTVDDYTKWRGINGSSISGDGKWVTYVLSLTNTAPNDSFGVDPHDTVIRNSPLIRAQIATFIKAGGTITDPCGATPCYAAGWMGAP